ncbi:MAG: hypothetical protein FWE42_09575 [Defluviitaleaceae bacterium]|nr:hypothetical protein [Defluviitaleaceae bacterium]
MKKVIINILVTTALSIVILAVIVRIIHVGYDLYFTTAVFQMFAANIVIHLGLLVTRKFESKYFALEVLLDVTYTAAVIISFGFALGWLVVTPVYLLAAMALLIYVISLLLNISRVRNETNDINNLIKIRDKKKQELEKENSSSNNVT